jgi:hypothetical protein
LGWVSGRDARHRCRTGLFLQSISIPQVLSPREALFRLSLHSRPQLREIKERTKRFYNNVNSKKLKSIEELATAIAATHNIIRARGEEVIPT